MIIAAVKRGNGGQLADYLLKEKKNDRATLMELRGFANPHDLKSGLLGIALEAAQTKGTAPFYHAALRLDDDETLTPEQWQHSIETLERRLKLDGQARAVVEHVFKGQPHVHVVWSLVDREHGRMIELPFDAERRIETARQIEQQFGLRTLARAHAPTQERLSRMDYEQAERMRRTVAEIRAVKAAIRAAWRRSDNGAAFTAALQEHRLRLALGDSERQPFGVVDVCGKFHVLTRTVEAKAQAIRAKLADLDRAHIPSVAQARAVLVAEEPERERER